MALTWLQLARAGAPPVSARTSDMVKDNKRKVFAKPPTTGEDGQLLVEPAVFKPRPRAKPTTATTTTTAAAPAAPTVSARAPTATAAARATPVASPFTFPGAVGVLNSVAVQNGIVNGDLEDDDDEDAAAGAACFFELMDELTTRHNCDAVRRMIQRFLARKTMNQTAFLRALKVNHNSFTKFMSYSGRDKGHGNKTYQQALLFFHELEGTEGASVDGGRASTAAPSSRDSATNQNKVSRKEQAMMAEAFFNKINNIVLSEPVLIYDDCDDVRQKLHELLEAKTVTQAALMKHLNVTTNSLRKFLTSKGKREGCTINVYRLAYIMFEKLRIAQGQPKTSKRLKNERELPEGFSLRRDPTHYILAQGETLPPHLLRR